jgi:hypothetical protein
MWTARVGIRGNPWKTSSVLISGCICITCLLTSRLSTRRKGFGGRFALRPRRIVGLRRWRRSGPPSRELRSRGPNARFADSVTYLNAFVLGTQQYASPGADLIRGFVEDASKRLLEFLDEEATNPDLALLEPPERETRVNGACKLVPVLYQILGILNGAEIDLTPAELVVSKS